MPDVRRIVRTSVDLSSPAKRHVPLVASFVSFAMLASGCVGIFASGDRASVSLGSHARGALVHGVAMPFEGAGYEIHPDWRSRDRRYTTAPIARWLTEVFRDVARRMPGTVVWLGDLSARSGGETSMHRSHASGRDIDIFYLARDTAGKPIVALPAMLHYGEDGRAVRWSQGKPHSPVRGSVPDAAIDTPRTWELVRAMLSSRVVEVQWIFIDESIADSLLREAERVGAPPSVIALARTLFHQPTDSQPHDDHMHVRVFCEPTDRSYGCNDKGPKRWLKKHWKYLAQERGL